MAFMAAVKMQLFPSIFNEVPAFLSKPPPKKSYKTNKQTKKDLRSG